MEKLEKLKIKKIFEKIFLKESKLKKMFTKPLTNEASESSRECCDLTSTEIELNCSTRV